MTWRELEPRWVLGQVVAVLVAVVAYFGVRGLTEGDVGLAHEHAGQIARLEAWLRIDVEHAVQAPVAASERFAAAANTVYVWGHWPVIVATMAWLVWRHRDDYRLLRDAMFVSGFVGMFAYATYPVAPPRLADPTLVDTVTRSSEAYRYLQPPAFVNQYAAMPSLHAGWDLLVGVAIFRAGSWLALRVIGIVLPMLMVWSVVATANHYVLDVVAGIALVLVAHAVARAWHRRRIRRREAAQRVHVGSWQESARRQ